MDPQPMGKVRDLGRLAERVACRPTVRWSRLWAFLGFCLLAAVVCGSAVDLPRAQGAGAVAGSLPSARAPTRIPQQITFDQPSDTAVGQPGRLTASSVTATTPAERTGLLVSFRSDTPDLCTVSGATLTPTAAGSCTVASQPGDAQYAPADSMTGSFPVGKIPQTISFTPPRGAETDQRVALSAWATSGLDVSYRTDGPAVCAVSGATVTPATVGTCTITASQPGNDNYAPAQGISRSTVAMSSPSGGSRR
jgi:hypothetical protein